MVMENDFLEKTLEEIIFENWAVIPERGFTELLEFTERQFRLPSGGVIDLLTWNIKGDVLYITIIELKKDAISAAAFFQLLNYYCELMSLTMGSFSEVRPKIVLVGNSIPVDIGNIMMITGNLELYSYKYNYDGIHFKKSEQTTLGEYRKFFNSFYKNDGPRTENEKRICDHLRGKLL